jgi:hypothetical protein
VPVILAAVFMWFVCGFQTVLHVTAIIYAPDQMKVGSYERVIVLEILCGTVYNTEAE